MKYNESLKEIRLEKGFSMLDVEKATGIANQNISRWESGQTIPGINFCIQLAELYDVSLDELVGLTNTAEPKNNYTPAIKPSSEIAEYISEYSDIMKDNNFKNVSKLFKEITPELRALALGYIVGILQKNGVNTKKILGY